MTESPEIVFGTYTHFGNRYGATRLLPAFWSFNVCDPPRKMESIEHTYGREGESTKEKKSALMAYWSRQALCLPERSTQTTGLRPWE